MKLSHVVTGLSLGILIVGTIFLNEVNFIHV